MEMMITLNGAIRLPVFINFSELASEFRVLRCPYANYYCMATGYRAGYTAQDWRAGFHLS